MPRVKRGVQHKKRVKNILKRAKGYKWGRKSKVTLAKVAILKAGRFAYRDRRNKKRDMRGLWNVRINAAIRPFNMSYSRFIDALKKKKIDLDRKTLAHLADKHPGIFAAVVKAVK